MVQQFKCGFIILVLVVALVLPGAGQTLFPSPQHQKMDYFAGDWKMQGTMKLSPTVPGRDFTSTEHSEWVSGNFFLQTKSSMHSVMGDTRGVRVMEPIVAGSCCYLYERGQSLRLCAAQATGAARRSSFRRCPRRRCCRRHGVRLQILRSLTTAG